MGLVDRLKDLRKKATDAAVEHQDQIEQAVDKAATAADQRTGGKYHEQIAKAQGKAKDFVQDLDPSASTEKAEHPEADRGDTEHPTGS